jgi:phosphatidylglycerophosphatase A
MKWLEERGVKISDMAELVKQIQEKYIPDLTDDICLDSIEKVLEKREVQNAVLTGLTLDVLTEKGAVEEPLLSMLKNDDGLYGIDEILALSIVNIYGSIGLTNFGYLDKVKLGIVAKLDNKESGKVNTFLDDLVSAIVAAAASRIAHRHRDGTLEE